MKSCSFLLATTAAIAFGAAMPDVPFVHNEQSILSSDARRHFVELRVNPIIPIGLVAPAVIGTPPQPFRLQLDLASNPLFVPSAAIKDETDNPDIFHYFSNQSTTFAPGPPGLVRHDYAGVTFEGELVNDTVQIATLSVDDQPFISAAYAYASEIYFWMGYDGILGLSHRWDTSGDDPEMPSPWSRMVQRGLLDHNLFAIDAPRTAGGEGELSLGSINPKYNNHKFRSIPLAGDEKDTVWTVTANSLTWKNHTHPVHRELTENAKAIITADWYIALPAAWVKRIHNDVKPLCGIAGPIFCEVECSARKRLPDLVIGLGGDNFTITAYEYAPIRLDKDLREWCSFDVYSIEALFDGSDGPYSQATVVIGLPFLNAFYSVFDLDRQEIRVTEPIS